MQTPAADPSLADAFFEILLTWPARDVLHVGIGIALFFVLAKVATRGGRKELWLVAALIPCWEVGLMLDHLAFRSGDEYSIGRGSVGAVIASALWWWRSGRLRTSPAFDPRWVLALSSGGLLLWPVLPLALWLGTLWPLTVAGIQSAVIGALWLRFGSHSAAAPVKPAATDRVARLFISYRREDSADVAGRIYDRLVQRFGKEQVFKDVDSIPLGVDFREHLQQVVGTCDLVVAVLGRDWLTVANASGGRRLDDAKDFVRIELEAALQRDIPVIPVLVRGAGVPLETDLPKTLAPFAFRNGMPVRADPDFHHDMDRLIEGVEAHLNLRT